VTHVGVQRLGTSHYQEHGAEDEQRQARVRGKQPDRIPGIRGLEHLRRLQDLHGSEHRQRDEPEDHDRTKQSPHSRRAAALYREKRHDDAERDRQHGALETWDSVAPDPRRHSAPRWRA
jgi:hypothetical protein